MVMEYAWVEDSKAGGRWLRELCETRGKTLREVDRATGISQQNISFIENGHTVKPSMAMLVKLGAYYGFTPNEVARRFGYWQGVDAVAPQDERIGYLLHVLDRLSPYQYDQLLSNMTALAERAEKEAEPR